MTSTTRRPGKGAHRRAPRADLSNILSIVASILSIVATIVTLVVPHASVFEHPAPPAGSRPAVVILTPDCRAVVHG